LLNFVFRNITNWLNSKLFLMIFLSALFYFILKTYNVVIFLNMYDNYILFIGWVAPVQTRVLKWWMSGDGRAVGRAGKYFRNSFLSNYLSKPLDISYIASTRRPILLDLISGLSLIHFSFTDLTLNFRHCQWLTFFCNITASWYLVDKCNPAFSVFDPFFLFWHYVLMKGSTCAICEKQLTLIWIYRFY
jgi:hypothetical protein